MRTVQRVFARAGVGIRHTEGFNPHAYVSVALPLSVGVESVCELLDFEVVDGTPLATLPELLNANLPEGIAVLDAYEAETKLKDIAFLRVRGTFTYDNAVVGRDAPGALCVSSTAALSDTCIGGIPRVSSTAALSDTCTGAPRASRPTRAVVEELSAFFSQPSILVRKLTKKKKETEVDIKPLIREISFTADGANRVTLEAVLAAQNPGLNPSLLLEALRQHVSEIVPDFAQFARVEVYDKDMQVFR